MLAAKTGRKKQDIVRMLLEDGLKEVEGYGLTHWKPERTTTKMEWLKEVD
jgi:predicted DNA-binding protein